MEAEGVRIIASNDRLDIVVIRSHMNTTHFTRIDSLADSFVRPSGLRLILQLFNRYQIILRKVLEENS
jgi:hypothetical protein